VPTQRFGALVQARRIHADLAQDELAERVRITRSRLTKIERGYPDRVPEPAVLNRLAEALEVTPTELLRAAGYGVTE
jgi:transcriptional regulator with XRE-family HTH domain